MKVLLQKQICFERIIPAHYITQCLYISGNSAQGEVEGPLRVQYYLKKLYMRTTGTRQESYVLEGMKEQCSHPVVGHQFALQANQYFYLMLKFR